MSLSKHPLRPYLVVFAGALFFLFEFINMNSFNPLNESLRIAFHVNAEAISNLSAMYFYANVIFLIPAGLLLDRISTRKMLLVAFAVCIASTCVFALTHSFEVAKVSRFITGMGSTLCLLSTVKLTSRWVKPHLAGFVIGAAITLAMLGGMLAQNIGHLALALGSWRYALLFIAGLGLIFMAIIFFCVFDCPPSKRTQCDNECQALKDEGFWHGIGLAVKNLQIWMAGLYTNFLSIPIIVLGALWGKDYLIRSHGLTPTHASTCASLIFLGMIFGSPAFGWISDRLSLRKLPMITGAVLSLITIVIVMFVPHLSYCSLLVLFFLLGFFPGSQVITYPLIIEITPKRLTASAESLAATLIMSAGAIFQPLYGYIMQQHWNGKMVHGIKLYPAAAYNHAMWILPITFIVSILLACCLKETHCKSLQE
jgi:MFS family permease